MLILFILASAFVGALFGVLAFSLQRKRLQGSFFWYIPFILIAGSPAFWLGYKLIQEP